MPAIEQSETGVTVRFNTGDNEVLQRVFGWVHWEQVRVHWVRIGEHWQIEGVEMVAPAQQYETVLEIVTGHIQPQLAGHRGPRRAPQVGNSLQTSLSGV